MTARILLPFLLLLSVNAVAGGHDSKPAVTVKELAPGIHVLMGMDGNIGVSSGEDGVFIIDDDMPPMATKVDQALRTIQDEPVRMVFNTHWHFDHTGGNEHFGK